MSCHTHRTNVLQAINFEELMKMKFRKRVKWGPWALDKARRELVLTIDGREEYAVDLERCGTAAAVLDWICQVARKTWVSPQIIGHLVRAINDTVNPQAKLCSWGMNS